MKTSFFFLFLLAVASIANGQTIDKAKYRCTYQTITVKDTTDVRFLSEDIMCLDIGSKLNYFYSQRKLQRDSVIHNSVKTGILDKNVLQSAPKGINKYVIYQNYPNGKVTFTNELAGKRTRYMYEEDVFFPAWEILPDKQTILKYSCQLATCRYRGREYFAWFTTELPFPFGPWKFGGLPGLILKISDANGHYSFEAVGFEKLNTPSPIVLDTDGYRLMSRKDYQRIETSFLKDPIAWINQNTGINIQGVDNPQGRQENGIREDHYAPIELE